MSAAVFVTHFSTSFFLFPTFPLFYVKNLQTRLKRAGRWLPVALLPLLPLAAQAQTLNYVPASAINTAGTYTDLGTTGTAITTANTDDANSAAQPIGFTFTFNGTAFTQFMLNTNGLIKLGSTAPSSGRAILCEALPVARESTPGCQHRRGRHQPDYAFRL